MKLNSYFSGTPLEKCLRSFDPLLGHAHDHRQPPEGPLIEGEARQPTPALTDSCA